MIKHGLISLVVFTSLNLFGQNSKLDKFCNQWIQYGYKSHSDSIVKMITEDCSKKKCEYNKNSSYIEDMYCLKGYGNWTFNSDSTKFDYVFTEYMGQKIKAKPSETHYYNHIILKLTTDTLIYGNEAYYGNDKIYGHDDWYFVRKK